MQESILSKVIIIGSKLYLTVGSRIGVGACRMNIFWQDLVFRTNEAGLTGRWPSTSLTLCVTNLYAYEKNRSPESTSRAQCAIRNAQFAIEGARLRLAISQKIAPSSIILGGYFFA